MKRYLLSFAASLTHTPEHPERTARRSVESMDVEYQVWPNPASMQTTLRMQGRRAPRFDDWRTIR